MVLNSFSFVVLIIPIMSYLKRLTDFETRTIKSGLRHGEGEQKANLSSCIEQTRPKHFRRLYQNCQLSLRSYSADLNVSFSRCSHLSWNGLFHLEFNSHLKDFEGTSSKKPVAHTLLPIYTVQHPSKIVTLHLSP
jgi:hypothetical protein